MLCRAAECASGAAERGRGGRRAGALTVDLQAVLLPLDARHRAVVAHVVQRGRRDVRLKQAGGDGFAVEGVAAGEAHQVWMAAQREGDRRACMGWLERLGGEGPTPRWPRRLR